MAKFWLEIKKEVNCLGALLKNVPPLLHAVDHSAGDNWFAFRKLPDLSWDCEMLAEKPSNGMDTKVYWGLHVCLKHNLDERNYVTSLYTYCLLFIELRNMLTATCN